VQFVSHLLIAADAVVSTARGRQGILSLGVEGIAGDSTREGVSAPISSWVDKITFS
jgi:hypothetical protein